MDEAYTGGLRRLQLAGAVQPEALPRILRERWRAAASVSPGLFWQGRSAWLAVRAGAPLTSARAAAGS